MPKFFSEPKNTNADNSLVSNSITLGTPAELAGADYLYMRLKNATGYIPRLVGQSIADTNFTDGNDDYQYVLRNISISGTNMTVEFQGTNVEVDRIYLLEELFDFDDEEFSRIDMRDPERGAIIQEDIYFGLSKVAGYVKRRVGYTADFQTRQKAAEFREFRVNQDNAHFYFLEDFLEFPDMLYPALMHEDYAQAYSVLLKGRGGGGMDLNFVIEER